MVNGIQQHNNNNKKKKNNNKNKSLEMSLLGSLNAFLVSNKSYYIRDAECTAAFLDVRLGSRTSLIPGLEIPLTSKYATTNQSIFCEKSLGGGKSGALIFLSRLISRKKTDECPAFVSGLYQSQYFVCKMYLNAYDTEGRVTDSRPFRETYAECLLNGVNGYPPLIATRMIPWEGVSDFFTDNYGDVIKATSQSNSVSKLLTSMVGIASVDADAHGPVLVMFSGMASGIELSKVNLRELSHEHLLGIPLEIAAVYDNARQSVGDTFHHWDVHPDNIFVNTERDARSVIEIPLHQFRKLMLGKISKFPFEKILDGVSGVPFKVFKKTLKHTLDLLVMQLYGIDGFSTLMFAGTRDLTTLAKDTIQQQIQGYVDASEKKALMVLSQYLSENPVFDSKYDAGIIYIELKLQSALRSFFDSIRALLKPNSLRVRTPTVTFIDFDLVSNARFPDNTVEHKIAKRSFPLRERCIQMMLRWLPLAGALLLFDHLSRLQHVKKVSTDLLHIIAYVTLFSLYYRYREAGLSEKVIKSHIARMKGVVMNSNGRVLSFDTLSSLFAPIGLVTGALSLSTLDTPYSTTFLNNVLGQLSPFIGGLESTQVLYTSMRKGAKVGKDFIKSTLLRAVTPIEHSYVQEYGQYLNLDDIAFDVVLEDSEPVDEALCAVFFIDVEQVAAFVEMGDDVIGHITNLVTPSDDIQFDISIIRLILKLLAYSASSMAGYMPYIALERTREYTVSAKVKGGTSAEIVPGDFGIVFGFLQPEMKTRFRDVGRSEGIFSSAIFPGRLSTERYAGQVSMSNTRVTLESGVLKVDTTISYDCETLIQNILSSSRNDGGVLAYFQNVAASAVSKITSSLTSYMFDIGGQLTSIATQYQKDNKMRKQQKHLVHSVPAGITNSGLKGRLLISHVDIDGPPAPIIGAMQGSVSSMLDVMAQQNGLEAISERIMMYFPGSAATAATFLGVSVALSVRRDGWTHPVVRFNREKKFQLLTVMDNAAATTADIASLVLFVLNTKLKLSGESEITYEMTEIIENIETKLASMINSTGVLDILSQYSSPGFIDDNTPLHLVRFVLSKWARHPPRKEASLEFYRRPDAVTTIINVVAETLSSHVVEAILNTAPQDVTISTLLPIPVTYPNNLRLRLCTLLKSSAFITGCAPST